MMYVMCFFQVFETSPGSSLPTTSSVDNQKQDTIESPSRNKKKPEIKAKPKLKQLTPLESTPTAVKAAKSGQKSKSGQQKRLHSNIPILSKDFQRKVSDDTKNLLSNLSETSDDYSQSSLDPKILDEYQSDIEDILTWLLGAEDQLKSDSHSDHKRFRATNFDCSQTNEPTSIDSGSTNVSLTDEKICPHDKIISINEAAEYAKLRFASHEKFMSDLTCYHQKILNTFEKGEMLRNSKQTKKSSDSSHESQFDERSKQEVALQMKLLDNSFNQLRFNATEHQRYLQEMLIKTQNAQLNELRKLMTQTEERISVLIPERVNEMPADHQSLELQLEQFHHLQQTMTSEQDLLKVISKFVIVTDDGSNSNCNFYDQLDALDERWTNVCKITENRGAFLFKLRDGWRDFVLEETRLSDWFTRLERRLDEIEDTIFEINKETLNKFSLKFLQDLHQRLDRMRIDILYGIDHSQQLHKRQIGKATKGDDDLVDITSVMDDDREDQPMTTPLSKITQISYTLLQLGENGMCGQVTKGLEKIRNRWDTLAGRIEHSEVLVKNQIRDKSNLAESQSVTPVKRKRSIDKSPSKGAAGEGKTPPTRRKIDLCGVEDWQNHLDSIVKWIELKETTLLKLSASNDLFNFGEITKIKPVLFFHAANIEECLHLYQKLVKDKFPLLLNLLKHSGKEKDSFLNCRLSIDSEMEIFQSIHVDLNNREKDFKDLVHRGMKIITSFKSGMFLLV